MTSSQPWSCVRQHLLTLSLICLASVAAGAAQQPRKASPSKEAIRLQASTEILRDLAKSSDPRRQIPRDLLNACRCVILIPSTQKVGNVIGLNQGILACRKAGALAAWGAPWMVKLLGAASGSTTDFLLLVMNPSAIDWLVVDNLKLGSDLSVAAGPVGYSAKWQTESQASAKVLAYAHIQGAAWGAELKGASLLHDRPANRDLYGERMNVLKLLRGEGVPPPPVGRAFLNELAKVASRRATNSP